MLPCLLSSVSFDETTPWITCLLPLELHSTLSYRLYCAQSSFLSGGILSHISTDNVALPCCTGLPVSAWRMPPTYAPAWVLKKIYCIFKLSRLSDILVYWHSSIGQPTKRSAYRAENWLTSVECRAFLTAYTNGWCTVPLGTKWSG